MTSTSAAPASRPISSAASRRAVAAMSASPGSARPPGKLTSPLWWRPPITRSVRITRPSPAGPAVSRMRTPAGVERSSDSGTVGRGGPDRIDGISAAGACGSGSGRSRSRRTASSSSIGPVCRKRDHSRSRSAGAGRMTDAPREPAVTTGESRERPSSCVPSACRPLAGSIAPMTNRRPCRLDRRALARSGVASIARFRDHGGVARREDQGAAGRCRRPR